MNNFDQISSRDEFLRNSNAALQKRHRETVFTAIALLVCGMAMLLLGITMYFEGFDRADWLSAVVLGVLCLLPGSYASVLAYGAAHKWRGYTWDSMN